ncbi:MAG: hypothetical protein Q4A15_10090 [Prevotellaceae bacterium]|nr:hypothetical protein [Prevotellaceae bacterium]
MRKKKLKPEEIFECGDYVRHAKTGKIYLIRELYSNNKLYAVQCFCKSSEECQILSLDELMKLKNLFYIFSFQEAFEIYWIENRVRLMLENKAEIRGVKLPKNLFEYGRNR